MSGSMRQLMRAVLVCTVLVLGAWRSAAGASVFEHGEPPLQGIGGSLDLTDQHGDPFKLKQLGGQPALVFFGFTRCSTTCPMALAQARAVIAAFEPRQPPPIIFVSLDPLSDTPRQLGLYLSHVDSRIIGLTGTPRQIEQAAQRYGVGMQARSGSVDHSGRWYLVGSQATVLRVYGSGIDGRQIAQDIKRAQGTARANPFMELQ